ncbi:acyltransferase [Flavobacterium sp.]|uniref:acyltransferase n=1 Tax=Flavobacterium sp. TaxID=239 RepID=UPI0037505229
MIKLLKNIYRKLRSLHRLVKLYYSVNWTKTIYFNFRKFPFSIAKKLPVFFYGKIKFTSLKGKIIIVAPVKRGMIGFGQPYEMNTLHKGIAEINISGKLVFKGHVQFGKDYFIFISANAYSEFGHMSSLGTNAKFICAESIKLGNYARFGSESQIIDTNFHQMINTITKEKSKITAPIFIGDFNYIGSRVTIMQDTITPNYCTIASNSLCNKDYRTFGNNILIGGIPAKLLKDNISRDWDGEKEILQKALIL